MFFCTGVPYSEHSSFAEMRDFCRFVRADRILPTVNNGSAQARSKMDAIFRSWMMQAPQKESAQQTLTSWRVATSVTS